MLYFLLILSRTEVNNADAKEIPETFDSFCEKFKDLIKVIITLACITNKINIKKSWKVHRN
jgi:predicted transporter